MSYPILYSATETVFEHNGLGILSDCVSCEVTEEANGKFELLMRYPMDGIHFEEISERCLVKAKLDDYRSPQIFRIYAVSKPLSGIVTISAAHISYDLSGIPVSPFSAPTAASALEFLKENAATDCPFDFWTDLDVTANFKVSVPSSIRSCLGGSQGSILSVYGGEYEFDNYTVKLHSSRGKNRGVSIRYGKNLTDIKQDTNCEGVLTGIYPYWVSGDNSEIVLLPEKIIESPEEHNFTKILPVDFSKDFETKPTVSELRSHAENHVYTNNIGAPSVSLSVSFAQFAQSEEYKNIATLERVGLFDVVNVEFQALGVSASAVAIKVVHDVIADKIKSISLGSYKENIADTLAGQDAKMKETAKNEATKAVKNQTSEDVFNRLTDNGRIQGIYVEDGKWYINAELAQIVNLFTQDIFMSGMFLGSGEAFFEPGWQELETVYGILSRTEPPTEEELRLFDFNNDGAINVGDYQLGYNAMVGKSSLANWSGAKKSDISVYIVPTDPQRAVRITGENMWGRQVDVSLGTGSLFNGADTEKNFNLLLTQSQAFTELKARVDALENT